MTVKYSPPENHYIALDIVFATEYGVNTALLFAKLHRLSEQWKGHIDDNGQKWVRLTYEEWEKELPFLSRNTIIRTIEGLEEKKLLLSTVFSGRSKWYRCNPEYVSTQNGEMHLPKMGKPSTQNGELPNSLPNSNPKGEEKPREKPDKPSLNPPPQDILTTENIGNAIKKACKINITKSNADSVYNAIQYCKDNEILPSLVLEFGKWFNTKHWPGKYPNPGQIISEWPKFESSRKNGKKPENEREKMLDPITGEWTGGYYS